MCVTQPGISGKAWAAAGSGGAKSQQVYVQVYEYQDKIVWPDSLDIARWGTRILPKRLGAQSHTLAHNSELFMRLVFVLFAALCSTRCGQAPAVESAKPSPAAAPTKA